MRRSLDMLADACAVCGETRTYGSEGAGTNSQRPSYPNFFNDGDEASQSAMECGRTNPRRGANAHVSSLI
jgi:hypothetical protein